jgi:hypothetical protein
MLKIEIRTVGVSFAAQGHWGRLQRDGELARILRDLAKQLDRGEIREDGIYSIVDSLGNDCGSLTFGGEKS